MKGEKINFIINSKNRDVLINPSASTIDVIVPSGLLQLQPDETFYLNVNGFYCFKNFYFWSPVTAVGAPVDTQVG